MGLFDFLSRDSKDTRAVGKWSKRLMAKYQQTAERKRAIEALASIGSEEAVVALLRRYQYRTEATIVDEDEKEMVFHFVVQLGESAVPGLIQYIQNDTHLYWPIKALREIVGDEEAATQVLLALDGIDDSFGANRDRREQLVDNLRGLASDERVFERLVTMVSDDDEEIVIRAIDGLSTRSGELEVTQAVVPLLLDDERSHRVRTMIMELMIQHEWNVKRFKRSLLGKIPDSYFIDDTGVVRRK